MNKPTLLTTGKQLGDKLYVFSIYDLEPSGKQYLAIDLSLLFFSLYLMVLLHRSLSLHFVIFRPNN